MGEVFFTAENKREQRFRRDENFPEEISLRNLCSLSFSAVKKHSTLK
jgi:hypothetical protein